MKREKIGFWFCASMFVEVIVYAICFVAFCVSGFERGFGPSQLAVAMFVIFEEYAFCVFILCDNKDPLWQKTTHVLVRFIPALALVIWLLI